MQQNMGHYHIDPYFMLSICRLMRTKPKDGATLKTLNIQDYVFPQFYFVTAFF